MTAFEPVRSGIASMDQELNFIRLGDNVVWQVTNLEEFSLFVKPYVQQAVEDHRNIIYIRFASHEPLLSEADGAQCQAVLLNSQAALASCDVVGIGPGQQVWSSRSAEYADCEHGDACSHRGGSG